MNNFYNFFSKLRNSVITISGNMHIVFPQKIRKHVKSDKNDKEIKPLLRPMLLHYCTSISDVLVESIIAEMCRYKNLTYSKNDEIYLVSFKSCMSLTLIFFDFSSKPVIQNVLPSVITTVHVWHC